MSREENEMKIPSIRFALITLSIFAVGCAGSASQKSGMETGPTTSDQLVKIPFIIPEDPPPPLDQGGVVTNVGGMLKVSAAAPAAASSNPACRGLPEVAGSVLQTAIDGAPTGGTVQVQRVCVVGGNLFLISKSVKLYGLGPNNSIILGGFAATFGNGTVELKNLRIEAGFRWGFYASGIVFPDMAVEGCVIRGGGAIGITALISGGASHIAVKNNTIIAAGNAGIWIDNEAAGGSTVAKNNIVVISFFDGPAIHVTGTMAVNYNLIFGHRKPFDLRVNTAGTMSFKENVTEAPVFADDAYHLACHSPGVDEGDPADSYAWEPQPNGNRIDMGAYGNTGEATPSTCGLSACIARSASITSCTTYCASVGKSCSASCSSPAGRPDGAALAWAGGMNCAGPEAGATGCNSQFDDPDTGALPRWKCCCQ
jgi:hypothetical protein